MLTRDSILGCILGGAIATRPGRLLKAIRRTPRGVCRITHHNDEAYAGALAMVHAIGSERYSPSDLPDSVVRDRLLALSGVTTIAEAARRGTSGFVADTVPLAIFASRQAGDIGFTEMISQIIQAGGDTDTIASLAGQIAGATLGLSGLPAPLLDRLSEREMILDIASEFADAMLSGPTPSSEM